MEAEITMTRIYDAPRDLVWRAWTEGDQLKRWFGPAGFTNASATIDARAGGHIEVVMVSPEGEEAPFEGEIVEFGPPERIVFSTWILAEDGHKGLEGTTTVDLVDLGGKTEVTVHSTIERADPEFAMAIEGMEEGWRGTLDRLGEAIEEDTLKMRHES
jgi:uncharacterized protein YndB with AHSA1/START domain